MRGPWGLGWRGLSRRPLRTVLTITGIAIGVALTFAALSVDAAAASGAAGYSQQVAGRADLVVRAFGEGTLSAETVAAIGETPGVVASSAQIRRATFASRDSGTFGALTLVGVDPDADRALHDEAIASGAWIVAGDADGIVVTDAWSRVHGVPLGATVTLVGGGGRHQFIVRGTLAAAGVALGEGGAVAYTAIEAARSLFGATAGTADRVELRVDPAVGVAEVETRLEDRLTREPYLLSTAADDAAALRGATRDVGSGLLLVAAVVLFVGALLVSDALAMSVAERTREVGLLRSAGATRGQVHRLVLAEAVWLGAAGTVIGIAGGAALGALLSAAVGSLTGAPIAGFAIDPAGLLVAALLGMLVTLAAALDPAWRAGRVAPVEALRRGPLLAPPAPRLRRLAVPGIAAALVGVALLAAGGWAGGTGVPGSGVGGAAAAVLVAIAILALLLIAGLLAPFVLRVAGALVAAVALPVRGSVRAELRLARGTMSQDPGRVAATFAALTVALALLVALAGIADGTRRAGAAWISDVAPADLAVVSIAPVPADFAADLAAVDGVASVTPVRLFDVAVAGRRASAMAVDPAAYDRLGALTVEGGDRAAAFTALEAGGAALVPRSVADRFGLRPGDSLDLRTAQASARLRVAAIVSHSLPGQAGESIVVSSVDALRSLAVADASLFLVSARPGAADTLAGRLEPVASQYALSVVQRSELGGAVTGALDRTFGLLDLLALAAVLIAALCILDVLAMDVRQRVGELGLLRAAGLTRRQAWRSVVVEAGILGLAGALLGTVMGILVSVAVLALAGDLAVPDALAVPWAAVVLALVLGVGGSVLAAAYPARLAARVQIVRALRFE